MKKEQKQMVRIFDIGRTYLLLLTDEELKQYKDVKVEKVATFFQKTEQKKAA